MLKIIAIDENVADLNHTISILRSFSFIELVGVYESSRNAIEEILHTKPDVVITSIEMQEINGLALTVKLQELLPGTRVILTTHNVQYAKEAYEAGAKGYMLKPIQPERLRITLTKWMI